MRVVTANILNDEHDAIQAPQAKRWATSTFPLLQKLKPDVVCLQEVQEAMAHQIINDLATLGLVNTSNIGYTTLRDRLMIATKQQQYDVERIPDVRAAQLLIAGDVQIIGLHAPWHPLGDWRKRTKQMKKTLQHIKPGPAIMLGDHNQFPRIGSRGVQQRAGFHSVSNALGNPVTFPINYASHTNPLLRIRGANIDDIVFRGMKLQECGIEHPDSDHALLWADLVVE